MDISRAFQNHGISAQVGSATQHAAVARGAATKLATTSNREDLRERVGEFVGNAFYGALLQQMNQASFKGAYLHGGRGEDVFKGQWAIEIAQRMGRAPDDPIAERIYESLVKRLDRLNGTKGESAVQEDGLE